MFLPSISVWKGNPRFCLDRKDVSAMSETQQPKPCVPEKASKPLDAPHPPWVFRTPDRSPAVVLLIVLLIVLQVVLAGIVAVQGLRLLDLGERIERLDKK
jgi:hypothetical protein